MRKIAVGGVDAEVVDCEAMIKTSNPKKKFKRKSKSKQVTGDGENQSVFGWKREHWKTSTAHGAYKS